MKEENRKSPKLRFPGFIDDWEQRKVTEIGKIYIGLVTTMTSHYTDQGTLLIRNSDIKEGRFEFGNHPIYLDDKFAEQNASRKHRLGDVITVHTGDIGTSAIITEKEAGSIGFATIVTRPDTRIITSEYLCAYLNTDTHKNFAMNISTGDGRNNYNLKDYYECVIPIPSLGEQTKISGFIDNLNNLITLHQHKLDQIKEYKKGMLQKMFPKKGETVPEVRFPGFDGDWEERKLGELGSFKNGMNFSKDAMGKGYPFVNLQNIFGRNLINTDNLGLAEATETQLKEYNLQEGDVLFVRSSVKLEGVGEAALVPKSLDNTTYSGFVIRFRDESNMNNNFKRFIFGTKPIRDQIMAKATNSANKNISQNVLDNLELSLPAKEEQQKIGYLFADLDNIITLHQHKLDQMREYKKGLLQQMFV